jgi:uncharacterized protein YdeI (YjbR/CyaY-like superfamily)
VAETAVEPTFFETPEAFRRWLNQHHATEKELWVGFYKAKSGRGGMVYRQALDEALCFGWIDGMVRKVDDERYMQRFTPRRKGSTWSRANVRRVGELASEGRIHPAGLAAFEQRVEEKTGRYSFEQQEVRLPPGLQRRLKADAKAWSFFGAQPASYRRMMTWWVVSAMKEETRERRLSRLIAGCAAGSVDWIMMLPRLSGRC